jgi:hypothetical protein
MIIAIIILSILLAAAIGIIFWHHRVSKNTSKVLDFEFSDVSFSSIPMKRFMPQTAYDGKYYPATVILTTQYNQPQEGIVTDFSIYEEKNIIGFTMLIKDTFEDSIKQLLDICNIPDDMPIEMIEEVVNTPTIMKNVVVYSPVEGVWTWKSQDT